MLPKAHRTISVEIIGSGHEIKLSGPEARSFVRRLASERGGSSTEETPVRIRIRHSGAKATGAGELIGALLEDGSLRFGGIEVDPIEAFRPWMKTAASGQAVSWPPERS